ncbi:MAG: GNAT family N-acetyltransferase [Alphaproteobacteria bacterium]
MNDPGADPAAGDPVIVRVATPKDAPAIIALQRTIAEETSFMLLEPHEVPAKPKGLAAHLNDIETRANTAWFVAESGPESSRAVVGYLGADGGRLERNRASARIFLGVIRDYWGRGVGRALFEAVEDWARAQGIRRLDLTVQVHNERGRALYEKLGYAVEGTMRESLVVDGQPVDELLMSKLL